MLDDATFSDFIFVVQGEIFRAHKAILAPASPVFHKMFTINMEEMRDNKCKINDIEPEVFKALLRYIYGGGITSTKASFYMQLHDAAHYYELKELMEMCMNQVHKVLTLEDAVEAYKWAHIYEEAEKVKVATWKMIKE